MPASNDSDEIDLKCAACGSAAVATAQVEQIFEYGAGKDAVELSATVPVHTCEACGLQYTDGTAEDIRHAAACEHLAVLAPGDIRELRKERLAISREDFSELTGIGTASLARWESGQVVQNTGYDRYLRLLRDPDVIQKLRRLVAGHGIDQAQATVRSFPSLDMPERDRRAAGDFQLRRVG